MSVSCGSRAKLKKQSGYYNFNKRTAFDFFRDVADKGWGATISDRLEWSRMRMDPEFVAEDGRLRLYVRDRHNRPLDVGGSNAKALAWGKENTAEIELKPSEPGALEGAFQVASLQRVIVTLHMSGHDPVKAWFSGIRN